MDPTLAQDDNIKGKIKQEWTKVRQYKRFYPDIVAWWERHVKPHLTRLVRCEVERNKQHNIMENHLYERLYYIMRGAAPDTDKYYALQRYKPKIANLNSGRRAKVLLGTRAQGKMEDEEPSLFHVLKQRRRRREIREIKEVQYEDGTTYTRPQDIRNTFVHHLARKFGPIAVDENAITDLLNCIPPVTPNMYAAQLDKPITSDDALSALRAGAHHRAPGIDGLSLEFYTANWDTISTDVTELNQMFLQKHIPPRQKQGILMSSEITRQPCPR